MAASISWNYSRKYVLCCVALQPVCKDPVVILSLYDFGFSDFQARLPSLLYFSEMCFRS